MTDSEASQVLDILKVYYPQFYKNQTDDEKYLAVKAWAAIFEQYPVSVVGNAIKAFVATDTKGFPPAPGIIMDKIIKLTTPEQITDVEAWQLVRNAMKNSGYHSQEEFEKLPPQVQRIVGSPSVLKEWAVAGIESVQTVIASNFQRAYRARADSEREQAALPESLKKQLSSIANQLKIERGGNN